MSERVERRVIEMIDGDLVSPYGNPVPGLEELGVDPARAPHRAESSLSEVATPTVMRLTVTRIGETPQAEAGLLADLAATGVLPGATISVREVPEGVVIEGVGGGLTVTHEEAKHLFVTFV